MWRRSSLYTAPGWREKTWIFVPVGKVLRFKWTATLEENIDQQLVPLIMQICLYA